MMQGKAITDTICLDLQAVPVSDGLIDQRATVSDEMITEHPLSTRTYNSSDSAQVAVMSVWIDGVPPFTQMQIRSRQIRAGIRPLRQDDNGGAKLTYGRDRGHPPEQDSHSLCLSIVHETLRSYYVVTFQLA